MRKRKKNLISEDVLVTPKTDCDSNVAIANADGNAPTDNPNTPTANVATTGSTKPKKERKPLKPIKLLDEDEPNVFVVKEDEEHDSPIGEEGKPAHPRKKKSRRLWQNLFFVVSLGLSVYLMVALAQSGQFEEQKSLAELFATIRLPWLFVAIGAVILIIALDSLKYVISMRATVGKAPFKVALKCSLLGKYYDSITPFASGGQPMQIYYLHKKKYSGGNSSAIVLIKFAFNISIWLTICCALMIFNKGALLTHVADESQFNTFYIGGWIGFAVNALIPIIILCFAFLPKLTKKVCGGILHLGAKMRIIKDKEATLARVNNSIADFINSFMRMVKKPWHTVLLVLVCTVEQLLTMMLPFFVAVAFTDVAASGTLLLDIMTLNVFVAMSVTVMPTPGNSGAIESGLMLALATVATETVSWVVIYWRFLSYYLYIIIGLFMTIVSMIRDNIVRKKLPKQTDAPPQDAPPNHQSAEDDTPAEPTDGSAKTDVTENATAENDLQSQPVAE